MAQASSNAQREPSMEEILASIRRIIEDSDAAGAAVEKGGESQTEKSTSPAAETSGPATGTDGAQASGQEATSVSQDYESSAAKSEETAPAETEQANETPAGEATEPVEAYAPEETTEAAADEEVQAFREELSDDGGFEAADNTESAPEVAEPENPMSALSLADIQAEVAKQSDLQPENLEPDGDSEAAPLAREEQIETEPVVEDGEPEPVAEYREPEDTPAEPEQVAAEHEQVAAEPEQVAAEPEPVAAESEQLAAEPEETAAVGEQPQEDDNETVDEGAGDENSLSALADAIASEAMNEKAEEQLASSQPPELPVSPDEVAAQHSAPIVSEQVGKQVAAAFDELNEAFSQPNPENFDRIAEAMMRPMLQDWLDNNLPVLVERLVREEIDRVARGASR